jgi:hypothetical protein
MRFWTTVVIACTILSAQPAVAAIQTASRKTGRPNFWPYRCVTLNVFVSDPPAFLTPGLVIDAVTKAASVWNPEKSGCGDMILKVSSNIGQGGPIANDHRNTVQFMKDWGQDPDPDYQVNHVPEAFALTTVTTLEATGEIIDTDVEINAVNFKWDDLVLNSRPGEIAADLQNTLTHEFGHVLGLDHNCDDSGQGLVDTTGVPAPRCSAAPAAIREATMWPRVDRSDVLRRDLAADDLAGLCAIYPRNMMADLTSDVGPNGNRTCNGFIPGSPDSGGCTVSNASHNTAPCWLWIIGGLFAARHLRRRR